MKFSHLVFMAIGGASAVGLNAFAQSTGGHTDSHTDSQTNHANHATHHADHHAAHKGKSAAKKAPISQGVMASLQASGNAQVLQDEVRLVFAQEAQGKTAAEVNRTLTQTLEKARAAVTLPEGVSMSSGSFRTSPSYNKEGRPDGWRGRAELVLQSTDFAATEKVAGMLGTQLALASVNFSLSPDKRRLAEQALLSEVAQTFRHKAQAAASAFGFDRYQIVSLDVGGQSSSANTPMLMRSAPAPAELAADPVRFTLDPSLVQVSLSVAGKVRFD